MTAIKNSEKTIGRDLVKVDMLCKYFPIESGFMRKKVGMVRAVENVSFVIKEGETLGMVGESGCGKSTIGKTMLRAYEPSSGNIVYQFDDKPLDVSGLSLSALRSNGFRLNTQMIFQDPNSSLDPRKTVLDIIAEPMRASGNFGRDEIETRVLDLMSRVGLDRNYVKRYPHAFSGGQRQRISIARALSTRPRFIVADEPTSALDVSIQAQILNLMMELQAEFSLAYLFVSHNLGVVRHVSDRVAVMYLGHMVELAENETLFEHPMHPYTEALMKAIPIADPEVRSGLESAPGEVGNPLNPPPGCAFHPRCPFADKTCKQEPPVFREIEENHFISCHHAEKLTLDGIKQRNVSRSL